jgi:hypothetical protein
MNQVLGLGGFALAAFGLLFITGALATGRWQGGMALARLWFKHICGLAVVGLVLFLLVFGVTWLAR